MPYIRYLVLSCLICLAMLTMPSLNLILAIVWGMLLIFAGLKTSKKYLLIIFAVNVLLLWFFTKSGSTLIYSVYLGLPALVMGVMAVNQNLGYYDLLKGGLATGLVVGAILVGLIYINGEPVQIENQINSYVKENLEVYENSGIFEFYEQRGIDKNQVEEAFYGIAHITVQHLPALYILRTTLIAWLTLLIVSRLAYRKEIHRLDKKSFINEIMPWQIAWAVIAGLAFWLLGKDGSIMRLIGSNTLVVLAPVLAYFGLSVLFHKLSGLRSSAKRWSILLVWLVIFFLTIPAFVFLALLGLFDSLLDYRKLRTDKEVPL